MAINFNNTPLPVGIKQFLDGIQLKNIVFDGVEVWKYDNAPPVLTITAPTNNSTVNGSTVSIEIKGNAYDEHSGIASLVVNGVNVQMEENGDFVTNVSISGNTNIIVELTDNVGLKTTKIISATQKSQAVYKTVGHSSGLTSWNDKYGTAYAPYCDHCGASWGSPGHCTWTTQEYAGTNYWYVLNIS